jgi:protein-L-isoaspartate(D-aspartate) O-methyltransferase
VAEFEIQRDRMVREVEARGVSDPRVLDAMRRVPRHLFVGRPFVAQAYGSFRLPSEADQTLSQPYVVGRTTELLELDPRHVVLEVGSGTGYQTAILARLCRWVFGMERVPSLASAAIERLRDLKVDNVKIQAFDGTLGWSKNAPFDRILVTASVRRVPPPLLEQLSPTGRLLIPEGDRTSQRLVLYTRAGRRFERHVGEEAAFVPLIGQHGWKS